MWRWLVAAVLLVGCAAAPDLKPVVGPRTALPALTEAALTLPRPCPDGQTIMFYGFDAQADGTYALMLYTGLDAAGHLRVPHVWIRFQGEDPVVALLVTAAGPEVLPLSELLARYPNPCTLLGTAV